MHKLYAYWSCGLRVGRKRQSRNQLSQARRPDARGDSGLDDPYAITLVDDESGPFEQRFVTLGMGAAGRLLVVVYAWRGENVRIISVRPAAAHEREGYEAER